MTRSQLSKIPVGSAAYVIAHAKRQYSRGKQPSMTYLSKTNPREALQTARLLYCEQPLVLQLGMEDVAVRTAIGLVTTEPSDENIELAIRAIVTCSSTKDEICQLIERLGCTRPSVYMQTPNDRTGFETLDLARALGGLVTKDGAMVMLMTESPSGNLISM